MSRNLLSLVNEKPLTPDQVRKLWRGKHEAHQPASAVPADNLRPTETAVIGKDKPIKKGKNH